MGSQLAVASSRASIVSSMEITGGTATSNSLLLTSGPGYARLAAGGDTATFSSVGGTLNVIGEDTVLTANGAQLRANAVSLSNGRTMTTFAGGRVTAGSSLSIDRVSSVGGSGTINGNFVNGGLLAPGELAIVDSSALDR